MKLSYDLVDADTKKKVLSKGDKLNIVIAKKLYDKGLNSIVITNDELIGKYIAEDIKDKNFRFRIYLHEPIWGGNITSYTWLYQDGYCLQNSQNVFK